jgi:hypothetical protein
MKKLIPLFLLSFVTVASGQVVRPTPEKEQSQLESLAAKSGVVHERQYIDVGEVKGIKVQIYRITDLVSKFSVSGVRFEATVRSSYSSDQKIAVLDADEIDAVIKTIEVLKANIFPTARESYTEVEYRSRGGFEAGAYFSDGKWTGFVKLEKYDSKSIVFMKPEDLDSLLTLLQTAKTRLK